MIRILKRYHLLQWRNLAFSWLCTKLFFSQAKLVRLPIDLRNYKYITLGKNFVCGRYNRIECYKTEDYSIPSLVVGDNVQINDRCHIACIDEVIIERNCLIASNVFITDHDHGEYIDMSELCAIPKDRKLKTAKAQIGNNVWLGEGVVILKGVSIADGVVVGSNAVVSKSCLIPGIYGGVPATLIKG